MWKGKRIRYVPHSNPLPFDQNADNVKTIGLLRPSMPPDPRRRRPRELPLLRSRHRLDRIAEHDPSTRLYLDERHQPLTFDDEIDIPVPTAKPTLHDSPSLALQPSLGDSLAQFSELLLGR